MTLFLQLLLNGVANSCVFALIAVAFGLVYRFVRIFHVALAGLFLICGYSFYFAASHLRLPFSASLAVTVVVAVAAGYVISAGFYTPFLQRRSSSAAILVASLGLFIVIENVLALLFGYELKVVDVLSGEPWYWHGLTLTRPQAMQIGAGVMVLVAVAAVFRVVPVFRGIRAMGDDPELVMFLGLPLETYRCAVFVLSTTLAGVAAALVVTDSGITPVIGLSWLLTAVAAAIVGGIRHFNGWVAGGAVLALIQSIAEWLFTAHWTPFWQFGALVIILVARPEGILAVRRRVEES